MAVLAVVPLAAEAMAMVVPAAEAPEATLAASAAVMGTGKSRQQTVSCDPYQEPCQST